MSIRGEFVDVAGMETRVLTVGGWLDDPLTAKHVVLVIPGNPGLVGFYETFMKAINSQLGVPVWAISHAGHELSRRSEEYLKDHLTHYTVAGQTQHKLAFIRQHVPSDVRITLIGHSIGCKIILDALKSSDVHRQVDKCYLLFPTIERMAVSPNGRFFTGIVKPFIFLVILASWLFYVLPRALKRILVSIYLMFEGHPTDMATVTTRLVRPKILRNVFYMAYDEMDNVKELDRVPIEKFGNKLVFYYGLTDGWVPLQYYADLKRAFPDVRVMACDRAYEHAFVLRTGPAVGYMVAEWIEAERGRRVTQE